MDHELKQDFITINQTCTAFDISRKSIYNLRDKGKLSFYKLGKKVYISSAEMDDLIRSGKEQ